MSKQSTKDLMFRGMTAFRSVHEVLDESFNIIERHGLMNQDLLTRGRYAMREVKAVFEDWGMLDDVFNEIAQDIKTRMATIRGFEVVDENINTITKGWGTVFTFDDTQKPEEQKEMPLPKSPNTIWKYTFPLAPGEYSFEMPDDISIMDCQVQFYNEDNLRKCNGAMWALLNPLHPVRTVHFALIGTGYPLPTNWKRADYIATIQSPPLVWHLFRIEKSPSTPENQVQD